MPRNQKPRSPRATSRAERRQRRQAKRTEVTSHDTPQDNSEGSHEAAQTRFQTNTNTQDTSQDESDTSMPVPGTRKRHPLDSTTKNTSSVTSFSNHTASNSTDEQATDAELSLANRTPLKLYQPVSLRRNWRGPRSNTLGSPGMLRNIEHRQHHLKPPSSPKRSITYRSTQSKPLPRITLASASRPRRSSPASPDAAFIHNIDNDFNSPPYDRSAESNINETNRKRMRVQVQTQYRLGARFIWDHCGYRTNRKVKNAHEAVLHRATSIFLAKIYTGKGGSSNLQVDPWVDRFPSTLETLIIESWTATRACLSREERKQVDRKPDQVSARKMKDRLGDFRIEANRKFRAIVKEVYGLGFGNDAEKAKRLLKDHSFTFEQAEKVGKRQFYHKAIVAAYADIFWANGSIGIARHRSSAKYFHELAGATICFIAVSLRHGIQEYLSGHHETIKYVGSEEVRAIYRELLATWDAMALHRRVAIEFRIFKDAKTRAPRYDDEDEQCPNAEPWRNPYNNVLDDLFEDLDDESTESLKAAIRMRCGGADSDYSTSSMQLYSSSSPRPKQIGGSALKGNNPITVQGIASVRGGEEEILDFYLIMTGQKKVRAQVPIHSEFTWDDFKNTLGLPDDGAGWYDSDAGKDQYVYDDEAFQKFMRFVKGHRGVIFRQSSEEDFQSM